MISCDKCTIDWDYNDMNEWLNGTLGEVRIGKGEMMVDVGPYWETVPIKFCPFCGRCLQED